MDRFYLGMDGGQSSTTVLIANDTGHVIGRGRGGPCNHVSGPEAKAKFQRVIGACVSEACREAHLNGKTIHFASACLGFSGGAEDKDALTRELIRSERYKITHDAEIALTGATADHPGLIVIAGTGSISYGRNAAGETARAGGWGYVFGDEGGGFDLTRRALRAALRFEEGWAPDTTLRQRLLDATGLSTANDLLHHFYAEVRRAEIAALSRLVPEAAEQGDAVARCILAEAATELARLAEAVFRMLFVPGEDATVSYIGGLFKSPLLRAEFANQVIARTGCTPLPPQFGPAAGAVLEALRADGNNSALEVRAEEK